MGQRRRACGRQGPQGQGKSAGSSLGSPPRLCAPEAFREPPRPHGPYQARPALEASRAFCLSECCVQRKAQLRPQCSGGFPLPSQDPSLRLLWDRGKAPSGLLRESPQWGEAGGGLQCTPRMPRTAGLPAGAFPSSCLPPPSLFSLRNRPNKSLAHLIHLGVCCLETLNWHSCNHHQLLQSFF